MFWKKSKEELEEEKRELEFGERISKMCNFLEVKDTGSTVIPLNACFLASGLAYTKKCDGEDCIFIKILKKKINDDNV